MKSRHEESPFCFLNCYRKTGLRQTSLDKPGLEELDMLSFERKHHRQTSPKAGCFGGWWCKVSQNNRVIGAGAGLHKIAHSWNRTQSFCLARGQRQI